MELMFNEATEALDAIVNTNEMTAKASIGLLIDMVCERYGGDPVELADAVAESVRQVNDTMGAYVSKEVFDEMMGDPMDALDNLLAF